MTRPDELIAPETHRQLDRLQYSRRRVCPELSVKSSLVHEGPCVVDIKVNRLELSMPPTITAEQALGFSLYMIRAVLAGEEMK